MKAELISKTIQLLKEIDSNWDLKKDLLIKYENIEKHLKEMLLLTQEEIDNIKNHY